MRLKKSILPDDLLPLSDIKYWRSWLRYMKCDENLEDEISDTDDVTLKQYISTVDSLYYFTLKLLPLF